MVEYILASIIPLSERRTTFGTVLLDPGKRAKVM